MMKRLAIVLAVLFAVCSAVFAAVPYTATVAVTPNPVGNGELFSVYGYIDHTTGDVLALSSMKLKIYKSGTSGQATEITSQDIDLMTNTENPDNLLLDGAYLADRISTTGFSTGIYTVQVLINSEVIAAATFNYDSTIDHNSTLTVSSVYGVAGNFNVEYSIYKGPDSTTNDTYDVYFYAPKMNEMSREVLHETLTVETDIDNSTAKVPYTSLIYPFSEGANIFLITAASSTDAAEPYIALIRSGDADTIDVSADLTFSTCSAKESAAKSCTFTVRNTGAYPASFTVSADTAMTSSVSFTASLIQSGQNATGTISLTAARGDAPSKTVTLNLYYGSTLLDTVTQSVAVEPRDQISSVKIASFSVTPETAKPGQDVTVTMRLSNTGDFTERVKLQYLLNEHEVTIGTVYTLRVGQNTTVTIPLIAPEETASLTVNILKDDAVIAGRITNVNVEPFSFAPFIDWTTNYKYIEQGNSSSNTLKVRNDGNTEDYFEINIASAFASLSQRVFLTQGQSAMITVPLIVSQTAPIGAKIVDAEICSLTTNECKTDTFTLTVLELVRDRSTIVLNNTVQELSSEQGAVFTIQVDNLEGETHTYKLSMGSFDGTLQVNPTQLTLLNGESGVFYVYAQPDNKVTQDISYAITRETDVVNRGNLTLKLESSGITGFITMAGAGDIGLIVFGALIIAGLVFIGVKSYSQSQVELKYWK